MSQPGRPGSTLSRLSPLRCLHRERRVASQLQAATHGRAHGRGQSWGTAGACPPFPPSLVHVQDAAVHHGRATAQCAEYETRPSRRHVVVLHSWRVHRCRAPRRPSASRAGAGTPSSPYHPPYPPQAEGRPPPCRRTSTRAARPSPRPAQPSRAGKVTPFGFRGSRGHSIRLHFIGLTHSTRGARRQQFHFTRRCVLCAAVFRFVACPGRRR